jgi:serine/threonine protein kinase
MINTTIKPIRTEKDYMAPEQGIGRPRLASDVYAVGAIGIQCLTGQYPISCLMMIRISLFGDICVK